MFILLICASRTALRKTGQLHKKWSSKTMSHSITASHHNKSVAVISQLNYRIHNEKLESVPLTFQTTAFHYIYLRSIFILCFYPGLYLPRELFVSFWFSYQHFNAHLFSGASYIRRSSHPPWLYRPAITCTRNKSRNPSVCNFLETFVRLAP
jgi:hypothetical protein